MTTMPPDGSMYYSVILREHVKIQHTGKSNFRVLRRAGLCPAGRQIWYQYMAFDVQDAEEYFTSRFVACADSGVFSVAS